MIFSRFHVSSIIVLLLVGIVFFFKSAHNPEVVYRAQTKEEEFSSVVGLIKELPFFKDKPYSVSLPTHKAFEEVYQKPELLEEKEESLRKIFYEEIYDASRFDIGLQVLLQAEDIVRRVLRKLAVLEVNWGFKIKKRYDVLLTLYGPGGGYAWTDELGTIVIKADEREPIKVYLKSILHEMVHIGIEENIVNKYNLRHWEKERLVDLICSLYLNDFLPEYRKYWMQKSADTKIDSFINEEAIIKNLPLVIEAFVAQYPREGSASRD